jgi:hypothetical protein
MHCGTESAVNVRVLKPEEGAVANTDIRHPGSLGLLVASHVHFDLALCRANFLRDELCVSVNLPEGTRVRLESNLFPISGSTTKSPLRTIEVPAIDYWDRCSVRVDGSPDCSLPERSPTNTAQANIPGDTYAQSGHWSFDSLAEFSGMSEKSSGTFAQNLLDETAKRRTYRFRIPADLYAGGADVTIAIPALFVDGRRFPMPAIRVFTAPTEICTMPAE